MKTFGAELTASGTRFRLWAPSARSVALWVKSPDGVEQVAAMAQAGRGFVEREMESFGAGTRYRFVIDGEMNVPDPASRFQPEGVHGPSEVVDPTSYRWRARNWRGRPWEQTVLYELHLGTFTPEGTFAAAIDKLDHLVSLGVTAVELMPVAEAPGERSWGYDGTQIFAPRHRFGAPDDLKALVDAAHERGLSMWLDVVYNHFGPEGNYLHCHARDFFVTEADTPWGDAVAVDGPHREVVRRFFIDNALYWLTEYRFDGLRLDAVHAIPHEGQPTFVEQLAAEVREAIDDRRVHLVVENDDNLASLLDRHRGAPSSDAPLDDAPLYDAPLYDAQWNDDFHHCLHVIATGEQDGYYRDYPRPLEQLGRCLAEGFAYQGEPSLHRGGRRRGEPSHHLPPRAFVSFVQNHDQVGNRALGERLSHLCSPEALDAALTICLLAPSIPLLFMGQEWAASTPFLFFCDFEEQLREAVRDGRREEFASFATFARPEARQAIPDPCDPETARRSRLVWEELSREPHRSVLARHRELLTQRREVVVPRLGGIGPGRYEVCGGRLTVTWPSGDDEILTLLFNAGSETLPMPDAAEPFAATSHDDPASLPRWGVRWWLAPRPRSA